MRGPAPGAAVLEIGCGTGQLTRSLLARGLRVTAVEPGRQLVARAREGDHRSVARLISMVENAAPQLREVMAALAPHTGHAAIVGLTGSPGVGKSTTTAALVITGGIAPWGQPR